MVTTSGMHRLLDEYLDALVAAGSTIESHLIDPQSEDYVRSKLIDAGYVDLDEVVGFLTWRIFSPRAHGNRVIYSFFYSDSRPLPVDDAIAMQKRALGRVEHDPNLWPGDVTFLPISVADSSEFMSIDCGTGDDAGAVGTSSRGPRMPESSTVFGRNRNSDLLRRGWAVAVRGEPDQLRSPLPGFGRRHHQSTLAWLRHA